MPENTQPKEEAAESANVEVIPQLDAEEIGQDDTGEVSVYAIAVKLAKFYQHAPEFWFAQIESQFQLRNIMVDATKYYHAVAALPEEVVCRVMPAVKSKS